jgi:signal transduction histidine kinase
MVALESLPLFCHLKPAELAALRLITQERLFSIGEKIFLEGAAGDGVYFVKSGLVEIIGAGARVFSKLGPGEIFGEMAVIEQRPRSATASAAQPTELYFIPRAEMLQFIEGSPALAFGLLQQISFRLREFNQLHLREVIEAERLAAIGNFARGIIHDLKSPLGIISLTAETLNFPGMPPHIREQAPARIGKQVERINDLVADILAFTEGRRTAEIKPVAFQKFILETVAELRSETSLKSVSIELPSAPPDLILPFDARRLRRVFHNLIHNAVDFLGEKGKIFLRFQTTEKEIAIEIEDTGPGIAPEIADQLFQPFATHGKAHGTGLGLSICKKIIEDHGGKIFARSEPNRGAIFSFTLPLAK